jgi:hypothetical protein
MFGRGCNAPPQMLVASTIATVALILGPHATAVSTLVALVALYGVSRQLVHAKPEITLRVTRISSMRPRRLTEHGARSTTRSAACGVRKFGRTSQNIRFAGKTEFTLRHTGYP